MNQPYFPVREAKQLLWFTNLQGKIAGYYTDLDISPARQAKLTLVLNWLTFAWQHLLPTRRQDAIAATTWRTSIATGNAGANAGAIDTMPPVPATLTPPVGTPFYGMLTWLMEEIARCKKAEGYTDTIGDDLGILGAAAQAHTDPPVLEEGEVAENRAELLFKAWEHTGIWIQSQVQGDADFTFLATDTASPYIDNRPVKTPGHAEWRDYRACWWDEDTPSMQFGPVLRVLVNG